MKDEIFNNQETNTNQLVIDKIAVIVQTNEGKVHQLYLDEEMIEALYRDLKLIFKGGILKILPTELHGITLQ